MTESKYTNSVIPESLANYLAEKCGRSRECKAELLTKMFEKVEIISVEGLIYAKCNERLRQAFYVPIELKLKLYEIQQEVFKKYNKRIDQKVIFCYVFNVYKKLVGEN